LSYSLWQQQFGGSAAVLNQRLVMGDRTCTIIGVMPADFRFPFSDTKVWEPVTAHPYWSRNRTAPRGDSPWLVLGRLRRGATLSSAQKEMDEIARELHAQYPGVDMPASAVVVPLD